MTKHFTLRYFLLLLMLGVVGESWGQTNNYFGTTGTINGSVWNINPAGPYSNALVTTGGAIINFGNAATPTGATVTVVGINATANTTWTAGGTLATGGTVAPIDVAPGITLSLAGQPLSTAAGTGFSKSGNGTLVVTTGGAYPGGFTLNAGTMVVGGVNAMGGAAGNTLTLNAGILTANGTAKVLTNKYPLGITIGGDVQIGEDPIVNASAGIGNLTFNNNVSLGAVSRTLTLGNGGTHTFSGVISGTAGIIFAANANGTTGTFNLNTGNAYTGKTQLSGGTVSGPGPDGSLFGANPGSFTPDQITFNGGTFLPTGNINFSSNRGITFTGTGSTINSNSNLVTLTSICTGGGGFTKAGAGTVLLAGSHTFSGPVTVSGGTLQLNAAGTYPDASALNLTGGTFDMNGISETIGSLAGTGGPVTSSLAGTIVLTAGGDNSSTTYSGVIQNGSATSVGLTKEGSGTLTLSGGNTLTGAITVNGGTLQLNNTTPLPTTQSINVNNTGTLRISQNLTLANITLAAGATLTVDAGKTLTITGTLTVNTGAAVNGTGSVAYGGTGFLVYNGTASLTAGIEWPTSSVPASITINSGATVVLAANRTTTALLTVAGTLDASTFSITGTGTVNINGTLRTANLAGYTGAGATFTGASPVLGASSTVDYYASSGNQVVTTAGPVMYANLTISGGGTKTPPNAVNISATLLIKDNGTVFDGQNQSIGGIGTNLTMQDNSKFKTGGINTSPDPRGTYTLASTSTIEFTNTSGTQQDIRLTPDVGTVTYGNIIVSGSNVGVSGVTSSIKMQTGTTFSVTSTGIFNVKSSTGFTGGAGTAVSNSPINPAIDLQAGSTINYNDVAQPLTPRTDYKNLTISGSGAKTAVSAFNVAETFTRSGTATLATTSPTYGAGATLAYVDIAAGRTYTAGLEWPITNPPTNLTVNLSGTGTRQVIMSADRTVGGNIALTAGELSIAANTLTVNGAFSYGTGTLTGTAAAGVSTSNLTLGGAAGTINFTQATAVTRSLNNLILNTASSAILGTALDLYGSIGLTSATLDLNAQHLTLKSNATNTARVADLTGSTLSNATNVTVERWIPVRGGVPATGGRAYRLLAPTVLTTTPSSTSIKNNWMEGGQVTTVGGTSNPVPGFGTHITGGTIANGFDQTQTNQASLYLTTNAVIPTYTSIANVNGNLNPYTGYFLFIRGGRDQLLTIFNTNVPPTPVPLPTSSTTLRATGTLQQGTKTNASFTNAIVPVANTMNLITNPYPSALDWNLVYTASTNLKNAYTLWDPNIGYRGGWVTVTNAGVVSGGGSATRFIQPGQAFFVETNATAATTVSVQESHKAVGNNNGVFFVDPSTVQTFTAALYYYEGTGNRRHADGVTAIYDNSFSASVDGEDASEINNWDENIAIDRESKHLAIEARPLIVNKDTLPLFMNNMKLMNYELEFKGANFNNDATTATLIDNFTGIRTGLSTSGTTVVPITVSSNPASAASNRFMVVFGGAAGPLPIDLSSVKAYEKNAGIQVDWVMNTEQDMDKYEVEKSADGRNFVKATTVASRGNSSVQVNYGWFDANPIFGDNFYRIKSIDKSGQYKNSNIVRVNLGKGAGTGISMYPNPFEGTGFNLQMDKLAAGKYTMTMYNNLGQRVYSGTVTHSGGSATQYIELGKDLAAGTYTVKISGGGTELTRTITKK